MPGAHRLVGETDTEQITHRMAMITYVVVTDPMVMQIQTDSNQGWAPILGSSLVLMQLFLQG